MNTVICGVNGFVGKHLARELVSRNHKVFGIGLGEVRPEISNILAGYWTCDLTSPEQVSKLPLDDIDAIINLAGLVNVRRSFDNAEQYQKTNVEVFSVIAERVLSEKRSIKFLAVSTGAVYESHQPLPLTESSKLITTAGSPYAKSKVLMEAKAKQLSQQGLDCVVVRPFNHIGPGQESGFLVPDLYEKIKLALSSNKPLSVGNLKTKRDYTDVRDVVRAYADLIQVPSLEYDIYNVCSGRSIAGNDILHLLAEACGASDKLEIEVDQSLIRPDDPADLPGSYDRLNKETQWNPNIQIEQTIKDFVAAVNS